MRKTTFICILLLIFGLHSLEAQNHEEEHDRKHHSNVDKKKRYEKFKSIFRLDAGIAGGNHRAAPGQFVSLTVSVFEPVSLFGEVEHYRLTSGNQGTRLGLEVPVPWIKSKYVKTLFRYGIVSRNNSEGLDINHLATVGLITKGKSYGGRVNFLFESLPGSGDLLVLFHVGGFVRF